MPSTDMLGWCNALPRSLNLVLTFLGLWFLGTVLLTCSSEVTIHSFTKVIYNQLVWCMKIWRGKTLVLFLKYQRANRSQNRKIQTLILWTPEPKWYYLKIFLLLNLVCVCVGGRWVVALQHYSLASMVWLCPFQNLSMKSQLKWGVRCGASKK